MVKKVLVVAGIVAASLALPAQVAHASTNSNTVKESVMDYSIVENLTKRFETYSFLTEAEKKILREEAALAKPHYSKINALTAKAKKITDKIMKAAKPLNKRYGVLYSKNMQLWMQLDSEIFEDIDMATATNVDLLNASKVLSEADKKLLMEDAKEMDSIDMEIEKLQAKADKAAEKVYNMIDNEYKELEKIYADSKDIWAKMQKEMDGK